MHSRAIRVTRLSTRGMQMQNIPRDARGKITRMDSGFPVDQRMYGVRSTYIYSVHYHGSPDFNFYSYLVDSVDRDRESVDHRGLKGGKVDPVSCACRFLRVPNTRRDRIDSLDPGLLDYWNWGRCRVRNLCRVTWR